MVERRSNDMDKVETTDASMSEIGRRLRDARQERGEDLYDIADYLRIRPAYLFALEEGDFGATPGRPYALGFLRTYADYLGFDGQDLVGGLKHPRAGARGDKNVRSGQSRARGARSPAAGIAQDLHRSRPLAARRPRSRGGRLARRARLRRVVRDAGLRRRRPRSRHPPARRARSVRRAAVRGRGNAIGRDAARRGDAALSGTGPWSA